MVINKYTFVHSCCLFIFSLCHWDVWLHYLGSWIQRYYQWNTRKPLVARNVCCWPVTVNESGRSKEVWNWGYQVGASRHSCFSGWSPLHLQQAEQQDSTCQLSEKLLWPNHEAVMLLHLTPWNKPLSNNRRCLHAHYKHYVTLIWWWYNCPYFSP